MLNHPEQPIQEYEPSRDDPDDALLKLDLDAEMDRFDRERAALLERIKTLTPDQWAITVEHTDYSHYGVFIMFRHLVLHDLYHAYRVEDRLLRKRVVKAVRRHIGRRLSRSSLLAPCPSASPVKHVER